MGFPKLSTFVLVDMMVTGLNLDDLIVNDGDQAGNFLDVSGPMESWENWRLILLWQIFFCNPNHDKKRNGWFYPLIFIPSFLLVPSGSWLGSPEWSRETHQSRWFSSQKKQTFPLFSIFSGFFSYVYPRNPISCAMNGSPRLLGERKRLSWGSRGRFKRRGFASIWMNCACLKPPFLDIQIVC